MSGAFFNDFEKQELSEWKKVFWKYELTIEYIDTDQIDIVNNIFDRLNRNGEPLTNQELRNAKFHSSEFYSLVEKCSKVNYWQAPLAKLQMNRLEHHEFISELLFIVLEQQLFASDKSEIIDCLFEKYTNDNDVNYDDAFQSFERITAILDSFKLDLEKFKIFGVSHLYGLFGFAWYIDKSQIVIENLEGSINSFYTTLRNKDENLFTKEYQTSMNAGTKSKARRKMRINALLKYFDKPEMD